MLSYETSFAKIRCVVKTIIPIISKMKMFVPLFEGWYESLFGFRVLETLMVF